MSEAVAGGPEGPLSAWRAEVLAELGGAPLESLRSKLLEGIHVEPLYVEAPSPPPAARRATPGGPATGRTLVVTVAATGEHGRDAVEAARRELLGGADGVIVGPNEAAAVARSLAELPPTDAPRLVVTGAPPRDRDPRIVVLEDPIGERMAAEAEPEPAATRRALDEVAATSGRALAVRTDPVHEAGGHAAQELGIGLAILAEQLRALGERGVDAAGVLSRATVTVAVGTDLLVEVSKLRALRACLARLRSAAGAAHAPLPWIHACTARRSLAALDLPTNALRVTFGSAAALLAGVELWTPLPFDEPVGASERGRRFSRLAPVVLREEGHLGRVVDPVGGAYAFDALTDALARAGWALFREIEGEGGFLAAWRGGSIRARVEAAASERAARLATRRQSLVGVSLFPNLDDASPAAPVASTGALPARRDAEPFERLRARAAGGSARPVVYLATLGPRSEHAARVEFSRGLFSVGGFEARQGDVAGFAASGARVACLCGADERYAAEAAGAARALREAGAARVVLAGKPGALEAPLREAGVSGFVHLGCDVPQALAAALDAAGGAS